MNTTNDHQRDALLAQLNAAGKAGSGLRGKWPWIAGGLVVAIVAGALLLRRGDDGNGRYVTETVGTGNLVVTASASGTLQPTKSVDVGSELSGTLASVLVQENDRVKKGQLLAELDTAKLRDAVTRSQASVAAAEAKVAQSAATVAEAKASLARMKQVYEVSGGKVPSKTELDSAEAALQRAVATEKSARADVSQARAALKTDETNLSKATIRSPVDGVVLTRKVEPGNTVVAAMNTPVLFVIAEDLTRMELQVKVDEADVAAVKTGQDASFTVAAWPGRKFPATISRVGMGATTTDNVVTYKTILQVKNDDLALRPGMTATASIVTAKRDNVLLVPNAALRFSPPEARKTQDAGFVSKLLPRLPAGPRAQKRPGADADNHRRVWVLEAGGPHPVQIETGVSNGRYTEVRGGELKAGMAVVTDYQEPPK